MVTKRDWLASLTPPLAKPGRGRFSREAIAAIAKAESEGMVFDDPAPSKPAPRPMPKPSTKVPGISEAVAKNLPGVTNAPVVNETTEPPMIAPEVKPQSLVRDVKSLNGYTKEGWKVNFATCAKCANHVKYCKCSGGPHAPSIVVTLDEGSPAQVG